MSAPGGSSTMILTCPACASRYSVAEGAVPPGGRSVRCQSCAHVWRASPDEPLELQAQAPGPDAGFGRHDETPAPDLAETPAPELPRAFRARAEQQRRLRRAAAHGAVWASIASLFVGLLAAGWLFRVDIVRLAPRAASAYAMVGLPVNATGLDFEAVSGRTAPQDPERILIAGALRNLSDREVVAPPVRVALLDAHGAELGHAVVRIDAAPVLPGGVQGFAAYIADPSGEGRGVGVDFAEAAAAPARPEASGADDDHDAGHDAGAPEGRRPPGAEEGGLRPRIASVAAAAHTPASHAPALDNTGAAAVSPGHHG